MNTLRELRKKFWQRAVVFPLGVAGVVLLDEYIKEGYLFKPSDILIPGTHESIVLGLILLSASAAIGGAVRGRGKDKKAA